MELRIRVKTQTQQFKISYGTSNLSQYASGAHNKKLEHCVHMECGVHVSTGAVLTLARDAERETWWEFVVTP